SPAETISPYCTIRCACTGMWYLRLTLPSFPLISTAGCLFSSGESTMMRRESPVTSSTSSCTVMPSRMSLKRAWPASSVRIENVYGSHSTSTVPCSTCCPSFTLRRDRKSTRLNSSHVSISYAVFCLKKKKYIQRPAARKQPASPTLLIGLNLQILLGFHLFFDSKHSMSLRRSLCLTSQ